MDTTTSGDDLPFVIQSLDAAIRHEFGFPVGETLEPAFSIDADGNVEILISLALGSSVTITEIVDSIAAVSAPSDDYELANVAAIRAFVSEYVLDFLTDQDTFVEKAGDTMTGQLVANGGITASSYLDLENARFESSPTLAPNMILQAENGAYDLIQFSGGARVGDPQAVLQLTGSQTRPSYKSQQLCLLSDLTGYAGTLDYVPKIGGTFEGQVNFDDLIGLNESSGITAYDVGLDLYTPVMTIEYSGDTPESLRFANLEFIFEGDVLIAASGFADVALASYDGSTVELGSASKVLDLLGSAARPTYNAAELALFSEIGGDYTSGSGITITDLGGNTYQVNIETNGIEASHMPSGTNGEFLRLAGGALDWQNLDVVAGTGIVVGVVAGQVTVNIDDLGVDTAQLAADAVTQAKIADGAVGVDQLDTTSPGIDGKTYSLIVTDEVLDWVEGGGGTGAFMSTAEILDGNADCDGGDPGITYTTIASGSSGPYIIEDIIYESHIGSANWTVLIKVFIDGNPTETVELSESVEGTSYINYPYYAESEFEIQARVGVSAGPTEGGTVAWRIQRLE
jgi:hypothetical protein